MLIYENSLLYILFNENILKFILLLKENMIIYIIFHYTKNKKNNNS